MGVGDERSRWVIYIVGFDERGDWGWPTGSAQETARRPGRDCDQERGCQVGIARHEAYPRTLRILDAFASLASAVLVSAMLFSDAPHILHYTLYTTICNTLYNLLHNLLPSSKIVHLKYLHYTLHTLYTTMCNTLYTTQFTRTAQYNLYFTLYTTICNTLYTTLYYTLQCEIHYTLCTTHQPTTLYTTHCEYILLHRYKPDPGQSEISIYMGSRFVGWCVV